MSVMDDMRLRNEMRSRDDLMSNPTRVSSAPSSWEDGTMSLDPIFGFFKLTVALRNFLKHNKNCERYFHLLASAEFHV